MNWKRFFEKNKKNNKIICAIYLSCLDSRKTPILRWVGRTKQNRPLIRLSYSDKRLGSQTWKTAALKLSLKNNLKRPIILSKGNFATTQNHISVSSLLFDYNLLFCLCFVKLRSQKLWQQLASDWPFLKEMNKIKGPVRLHEFESQQGKLVRKRDKPTAYVGGGGACLSLELTKSKVKADRKTKQTKISLWPRDFKRVRTLISHFSRWSWWKKQSTD